MLISYIFPAISTNVACSDILSFYGEGLAGEEDNYIHGRARASGSSTPGALQEVIDDTVMAVKRVRGILGNGPARAAWENFAARYVYQGAYRNPRYRLKDILGGVYIIDMASSILDILVFG